MTGPPPPSPPSDDDPLPSIAAARAALDREADKARLSQDPLGPALAAVSAALGAFAGGIAAVRSRPADEALLLEAADRAAKAAAAGAKREAAALVGAANRRLLLGAGAVAAMLALALGAGGFLLGRAAGERGAAAAAREAGAAVASGGPAAAEAWAALARSNDVLGALRRCEGRALWADAAGRRACAVPLWLDPPAPSAPPTPARGAPG